MKTLKYIFISIASIMLLMSSCAKDEKISMGSLKVETNIEVLSPTIVCIRFASNSPLFQKNDYRYYSIRYKKVSDSEYTYSYQGNCEQIENGIVITRLEPNSKYIFEVLVDRWNFDWRTSEWLSDPSFTFSTDKVSQENSPLNATVAIESLTNTSVNFSYKLSENVDYTSLDYIYLNTDPNDTGNRIVVTIKDSRSKYYNCYANGLQPETTYYIFAHGDIRLNLSDNNTIYLDDVSINLTPNSFTTMSNESFYEGINKASMSTSFLSQDRAVIKIQYDDSIISYSDNLSVTISENQDGSNPIITTNPTSMGKNSYIKKRGIIEFAVAGLKPSTKYYIFVKGDVVYELTNLQGYEKAKDIPLSFSDNSFTTKEAGDYGIDLNAALTINYTSKFRTDFQFDFDKNLTTYSYDAKITLNGLQYECFYVYYYSVSDVIKFYVSGLNSNTTYTIDQFLVTMFYTTDSGVQIPLGGSIDNPEPIDIIPTPNSFTTPDWK